MNTPVTPLSLKEQQGLLAMCAVQTSCIESYGKQSEIYKLLLAEDEVQIKSLKQVISLYEKKAENLENMVANLEKVCANLESCMSSEGTPKEGTPKEVWDAMMKAQAKQVFAA